MGGRIRGAGARPSHAAFCVRPRRHRWPIAYSRFVCARRMTWLACCAPVAWCAGACLSVHVTSLCVQIRALPSDSRSLHSAADGDDDMTTPRCDSCGRATHGCYYERPGLVPRVVCRRCFEVGALPAGTVSRQYHVASASHSASGWYTRTLCRPRCRWPRLNTRHACVRRHPHAPRCRPVRGTPAAPSCCVRPEGSARPRREWERGRGRASR